MYVTALVTVTKDFLQTSTGDTKSSSSLESSSVVSLASTDRTQYEDTTTSARAPKPVIVFSSKEKEKRFTEGCTGRKMIKTAPVQSTYPCDIDTLRKKHGLPQERSKQHYTTDLLFSVTFGTELFYCPETGWLASCQRSWGSIWLCIGPSP